MLQSLTHCCIRKDTVVCIKNYLPCGCRVRHVYGKSIFIHVLVNGISVKHVLAEDHVYLALFKCKYSCLIIRNNLNCYLFNSRLFSPVIFICFKNGILIRHKIRKHIRTGSYIRIYSVHCASILHRCR